MWIRFFLAPAVAATVLTVTPDVLVVQLQTKTLAAFERYVTATEARIATELDGRQPFLWVNRQPAQAKAAAMARLTRGEVIPVRLETWDKGKKIDVDDGMIHHWIGSVLLPGVSLAKARAVVERYDQYPRVLGPMVQRASILQHTGTDFVVQMRTSVEKVITVVMDADYRIAYRAITPSKLYTRSVAVNVFEVKSAGEAGEQRIPGDKSSGFLWRLNTYCSFEEIPEGTIEQCESISLTRGIPWGFGFIVGRFVNSIPRETLEFTLGRVREEAVKSLKSAGAR
jgi:hypothetical protein